MALVTIEGQGTPPTPNAAAKQLRVGIADIDAKFGVVLLDPTRRLYSIRVQADRLPAAVGKQELCQGPFSDSSIVPSGPIQDQGKQEE